MCVIVYKPIKTNVPSKDTLKKCFTSNPDGAGYMLPLQNQVIIRKGFMTFNEFYDDFKSFTDAHKIDVFKTPIVFHFRITTQGGVQKELCHPYPICREYDTMRELSSVCDIALAHNGIISLTSTYGSYGKQLPYNDTMTFIKKYASLIIDNDIYFGSNKNKCELLENLISGSRLAIMNKLGYVKLIGNFEKIDKVYYSNTHFLQKPMPKSKWQSICKTYYDDDYDMFYGKYGDNAHK